MIRLSVLTAIALLVTGCADEPEPEAQPQAAPMGEVLEGSISDEMIPYDLLRSQAPLEDPAARGAGDGRARSGAAGETSGVGAPDAEASPAGEPAE